VVRACKGGIRLWSSAMRENNSLAVRGKITPKASCFMLKIIPLIGREASVAAVGSGLGAVCVERNVVGAMLVASGECSSS